MTSLSREPYKHWCLLLLIPLLYISSSRMLAKISGTARSLNEFTASNPKQLRFMTFGTSRTYGSGIERRELAYPYLLSPDTTNLAIRASGPDYPALCTASMVGSERYDVIIMEYYLRARDNMDVLAKRLRERFPEATLIFIVTRPAFMFYHTPSKSSLKELLKSAAGKDGWNPERVEDVLKGTTPDEWELLDPPELMKKVREVARDVGGYVFELRVPDDMFEAIRWYGKEIFIHDQTHYSEYGHQVVYHGIQGVLDATNAARSDVVGEWGYKDNCDLWFQSGKTDIIHHPGMILRSFSDHQKFGLENPTNMTGWVQIDNPSQGEASLYVQFMATNPPRMYPLVNLSINGDSVVADPTVSSYKYNVHVTKLVKVSSRVPPGGSRLEIKPLEETSTMPFRITGVIVTPAENVNISPQ